MTNYIMPTSADLPPIRVFFEELGNVHGAFGAKGIGELPMDGPAPAIVNAVENALKVRFDSIPLLPEDICEALTSGSEGTTRREPEPVGGVR
jgi:CO/xanthine dehydrogenase Mo-binding subunit